MLSNILNAKMNDFQGDFLKNFAVDPLPQFLRIITLQVYSNFIQFVGIATGYA